MFVLKILAMHSYALYIFILKPFLEKISLINLYDLVPLYLCSVFS